MTRVGLVVTSVLAGVLGIGAGGRTPGRAAARRADLGLARVRHARARARGRSSRASSTRSRGRDVLIVTGRFGFKTYDVSDPSQPAAAGHVPAAGDPRRERLLAGRGHGHRRPPQPDHRRARPASRQRRPGELPGIGTLGSKTRNPGCRSGFYVISYADPENLKQVGDFVDLPAGHTVSCIEDCHYVWTGGPARRNDQAYLGPFTPGGRGDGRPIWVTDLRTRRTRRCSPSRSTSGATTG